jgi:hypothetical protein
MLLAVELDSSHLFVISILLLRGIIPCHIQNACLSNLYDCGLLKFSVFVVFFDDACVQFSVGGMS